MHTSQSLHDRTHVTAHTAALVDLKTIANHFSFSISMLIDVFFIIDVVDDVDESLQPKTKVLDVMLFRGPLPL